MKKLGFGMMRLPQIDNNDFTNVNQEQVNKMFDLYMEAGFNYFDTGYHYHLGASEKSLKKALVDRYPRESFLIADKIPAYSITKEEELEPIFNEQLERCGVDYFDYYLIHNVSKYSEPGFVDVDSFSFVKNKYREGKVKHWGISFHDTPEMLDDILNQYPDIQFVQLQINYLDWENPNVQSRKCYEIARKHNKDIIVMEPIKGGSLANLPEEAEQLMKEYNPNLSIASWAIRFVASLDGVTCVLSGMNTLEQVEDNISFMKEFTPINDDEKEIINKVTDILNGLTSIPCTNCKYCIDYCPKNIDIPKLIGLYNMELLTKPTGFSPQGQYYRTYAKLDGVGIASDCIECGSCVEKCPQHINIPEHMKEIKKVFEIPRYGF